MTHDILETIVRTHQAMVYRYLRYMGAAADVAEDVAQETFLAAYRSGSAPIEDAATEGGRGDSSAPMGEWAVVLIAVPSVGPLRPQCSRKPPNGPAVSIASSKPASPSRSVGPPPVAKSSG